MGLESGGHCQRSVTGPGAPCGLDADTVPPGLDEQADVADVSDSSELGAGLLGAGVRPEMGEADASPTGPKDPEEPEGGC